MSTENQSIEQVKVYNLGYALEQLKRLFNALVNATGDPATATMVIEKIADGIVADPETAQKFMTPENIGKVFELKAKADAGTLKLQDIEAAFPIFREKFGPILSMVSTFMK